MASKADRFYFENFVKAADTSCKAASFLTKCLENYNHGELKEMMKEMHAIEHEADGLKHDMSSALAKAFVTPVDREDLALISQNIDEVTDSLEEILQRFYVNHIESVLPDAIAFSKMLFDCCETMKELLTEFSNFKKPAKLHNLIIELSHKEEECDALYLEALYGVPTHFENPLEIIYWREILESMEKCADACEHVADCVETVVMKNT